MSTDNSPQKITISAPDDLSLGKQVDYEFEYNPVQDGPLNCNSLTKSSA